MMGLGRPPLPAPPAGQQDQPNTALQKVVTETDDLRSTKLAFILGRRSSEKAGVGNSANLHDVNSGDPLTGFNEDEGALGGNSLYDYGFQLAINSGYAPGVPGTERFQQLETSRTDWVVTVRPEQVVEVAFDGVQRSPRYPGGVALRFARVVRYRDDKSADEADTIETVRGFL